MSGSPAELGRAVIQFWCDELNPEQHWKKDPAMDRHIAEQFGKVREEVMRSNAQGWRDSPETLAAAIILLDQFSRNMFRGSPKAFEADSLALELSGAKTLETGGGIVEGERGDRVRPDDPCLHRPVVHQ